MADESRILRERQSHAVESIQRTSFDLHTRTDGRRPDLVQVVSGVTLPTQSGYYFPCQRVLPGGPETSGGLGTFTAVSGTFPVLVIGHRVPVAGDRMFARQINGRWISEGGGKQKDKDKQTQSGCCITCTSVPSRISWGLPGPAGSIPPLLLTPLIGAVTGSVSFPVVFTYQPTPGALGTVFLNTNPYLTDAYELTFPTNGWYAGPYTLTFAGPPPTTIQLYYFLYFAGCFVHILAIQIWPFPVFSLGGAALNFPGNCATQERITPTLTVVSCGGGIRGPLAGGIWIDFVFYPSTCDPFSIAAGVQSLGFGTEQKSTFGLVGGANDIAFPCNGALGQPVVKLCF